MRPAGSCNPREEGKQGSDLVVPSRYQGVLQDGQTPLRTRDTSLLGAWVEMLREIQLGGEIPALWGNQFSKPKLEAEMTVFPRHCLESSYVFVCGTNQKGLFFSIFILLFFLDF